ncbi:membrane fusogenic activity family protein [Nocardiopsis sp. NPDC055551]|uniref:membrane fusogenic activity family protein n=1 Tax=Nocardiopsis sp. NPDC006832 TaxID=3157188 RepID=UPI0033FC76E7
MVVDAVRTYLDAANGLTELSRKEAVAAAKALLRAGGANGAPVPSVDAAQGPPPRVGQNIQALAGELIETSQANRAAIADLVRAEVGRALEELDVVPRAEHDRLVRRVAELERRLGARYAVERVPGRLEPVAEEETSKAEPAEPDPAPEPVEGPADEAEPVSEPEPESAPTEQPASPSAKTGTGTKTATKPTAKNTRARSTAKRTTKGKSAKK